MKDQNMQAFDKLPLSKIYSPDYSFPEGVTELYLKEKEETELSVGVLYLKERYIDDNGFPVVVCSLFVDLQKNLLYMGTSDDSYSFTVEDPEKRQTTMEHMEAAIRNGYKVIAGVNADYFAIDSDYSPRGLAIKEGKRISPTLNDWPFFGVAYDGKALISKGVEYTEQLNLRTAVGGGYFLLKNGEFYEVGEAWEHYGMADPRTMIGIRRDRKVVISVIDGRQPDYSLGIYFPQQAALMVKYGCTDALNLDGGGSTCLIFHNKQTGKLSIESHHPDGDCLRKVFNSLLIVQKSSS